MFYRGNLGELYDILDKSAYSTILYKNIKELGIKFNEDECLLKYDNKFKKVNIELKDGVLNLVNVYVEVETDPETDKVTTFKVGTCNMDQRKAMVIEKILYFIFIEDKAKNIVRNPFVEVVLPGIFYSDKETVQEGKMVWQDDSVAVLLFEDTNDGLDAYVSVGFTNEKNNPSDIMLNWGQLAGYGYELMIFTEPGDKTLVEYYIKWIKYIKETGKHIYPGQYLQYKENSIPGTKMAGFLVLMPAGYSTELPINDGYGILTMLLAVNEDELEEAIDCGDVYEVAEDLFDEGYKNYRPIR